MNKLYLILTLLTITVFFVLMLFTQNDKNRTYIKFVLIGYPLMAITISYNNFAFAIFDIITFIFLLFLYKRKYYTIKTGSVYTILFFILTATILIGLFLAESLTSESLRVVIQYVSIIIFAKILIEEFYADREYFFSVIYYLKFALIISLIFLICQFIFGTGFTFDKTTNINVLSGTNIRYPSYFQDPQKYAQFLSAVSFLFLIKDPVSKKLSNLNYILLIFTLVALLYTGGRAALGGLFFGIGIILFFGRSQYKLVLLSSIIVLGFIAFNFSSNFAMLNRGATLTDAYDFRYSIWQDAYKIFESHPLFGIGIGNYANYVYVHNPDQFWVIDHEITYFDHPESGYLKLLTEFGIIGFVALFSFLFIIIFKVLKQYVSERDNDLLLLIAALGSWFVGFYTVYSLGDLRIRLLILVFTLLLYSRYKWNSIDAKEQITNYL